MLGLFGLNPEIKLPVREGRSIFLYTCMNHPFIDSLYYIDIHHIIYNRKLRSPEFDDDGVAESDGTPGQFKTPLFNYSKI